MKRDTTIAIYGSQQDQCCYFIDVVRHPVE